VPAFLNLNLEPCEERAKAVIVVSAELAGHKVVSEEGDPTPMAGFFFILPVLMMLNIKALRVVFLDDAQFFNLLGEFLFSFLYFGQKSHSVWMKPLLGF
jgi:hypothetical protein